MTRFLISCELRGQKISIGDTLPLPKPKWDVRPAPRRREIKARGAQF